jgi:hypothetical protein
MGHQTASDGWRPSARRRPLPRPGAARAARPSSLGGPPPAATVLRAAWLLVVTTWAAADCSRVAVRRLDRARGHVARVWKRMHPRLRLPQLRRQHPPSVDATVRARLLAWMRQDGMAAAIRPLWTTLPQASARGVRRGLLTGGGLETRRQPSLGSWAHTRLQAGLPRVPRFLTRSPRRRTPQETAVRAGLAGHDPACPDRHGHVACAVFAGEST